MASEGSKTFFDDTLAADLVWQDFFPPSAGGPFTSTITAAVISAIGQSLTTNAKKQSAVTAATVSATGQTLTTKIAKTSLIVATSITATGQSITTNAKRVSLIVAASIAATAQNLTTNAKRVSSIAFAQITATGQALSTKISKRSEVLAATITATAQSLTTRVTSETVSEVVAATIAVSAQALSTSMTTISSVTNATIAAIGRTVVTKGSAVMAEVSGIMDTLHDLTNRLLDVVLLGSSNNDTPTGYYEELARACEALAGTSPSPLANPVDDGYLLRAATALETISSTDGSAENANYNGLLKRTVDALEDYTGTSSEGTLLHRLRMAVYQL